MHNFWHTLKKPIIVLAPMADVTDAAFRRVIAKYGKPDITWTEFVSADGLVLAPEEGRKKLLKDLEYSEGERPIVAQLFSSRPENMEKAAALCRELGFDGVDINMGCPDRAIERQGAGSAHIKDPKRAQEVIYAAMQGANGLSVSVKTRVGYNKDELDTWLPMLLETNPVAITVHARTRKEMSKVPARWGRVRRAVEIRNELGKDTLILGNGDVQNLVDAVEKVEESGADGAMLGRAIFGNPWLFKNLETVKNNDHKQDGNTVYSDTLSFSDRKKIVYVPDNKEKLEVMVEHTKLFEELLPHKNFAIMKKHYKAYVKDFDGAAELRARLMEAPDAKTVEEIVNSFCGRL